MNEKNDRFVKKDRFLGANLYKFLSFDLADPRKLFSNGKKVMLERKNILD